MVYPSVATRKSLDGILALLDKKPPARKTGGGVKRDLPLYLAPTISFTFVVSGFSSCSSALRRACSSSRRLASASRSLFSVILRASLSRSRSSLCLYHMFLSLFSSRRFQCLLICTFHVRSGP